MRKSPLFIIFTTVFMDLIGFGLIIPLVALYGREFGATPLQLGLLGGAYSAMQFIFAPIWGRLSDKHGRRPILLMSLAGSTLAYFGFAFAGSFTFLILTRMFAGAFAANISTAQAFVADVTKPEDRAKGMGLIGAAFGLGFLLGPGLAIFSLKVGGSLKAPGLVAGGICAVNFLIAIFRLPESLTPELRAAASRVSVRRNSLQAVAAALTHPRLATLYLIFFLFTFAMANMEQTFSVFFENRFALDTVAAGRATGWILVAAGLMGVLVQGGLVRRMVPRFGEYALLVGGLCLMVPGAALLPFGPDYNSYFFLIIPIALGSGLLNPSLSALISRNAGADAQGVTLGMSQGLGSLARAVGPFCGLTLFHSHPAFPFFMASFSSLLALLFAIGRKSRIVLDPATPA